MSDLSLMLIKINPDLRGDRRLANWIEEIDRDYMARYPLLASIAHVKLEGPWDFGLLFHGTSDSVAYLEDAIRRKGPTASIQDVLTMPAIDLDDYTRSLRTQA